MLSKSYHSDIKYNMTLHALFSVIFKSSTRWKANFFQLNSDRWIHVLLFYISKQHPIKIIFLLATKWFNTFHLGNRGVFVDTMNLSIAMTFTSMHHSNIWQGSIQKSNLPQHCEYRNWPLILHIDFCNS